MKPKLGFQTTDVLMKMSYQYSVWMEIDEGNGSAPQYITEDVHVHAFIEMRRSIEEVNLYVTVVKIVTAPKPPVVDSLPLRCERHWLNYISANSEGDSTEYEMDEEWNDFVHGGYTQPGLMRQTISKSVRQCSDTLALWMKGVLTIGWPQPKKLGS